MVEAPEKHRVVIVGGGVAGLYAAHSLDFLGITDFVLLEANNYLGGRVKYDNKFFEGRSVEVGAEVLHGQGHLFHKLADELGLDYKFAFNLTQEDKDINTLLFHVKTKNIYTMNDKKTKKMLSLLDTIENYDEKQDSSLYDWFMKVKRAKHDKEIDEEVIDFADTYSARTSGTTLKNQGVWGLIDEDHGWTYGRNNFLFTTSYSEKLLPYLSRPLGARARLNTAVTMIIKGHDNVILVCNEGGKQKTIICEKVIVTVPLSMLKKSEREAAFANEQILFEPPLKEKQDCIDTLQMEGGFKVFCQFSSDFIRKQFPSQCKNTNLIFAGGHPLIPQFWIPPTEGKTDKFYVHAFSVGNEIDAFTANGHTNQDILKEFVAMLDDFVRALAAREGKTSNIVLASDVYEKGLVQNWSAVPYIRGGYSSSSVGVFHARDKLALPCWDNRLFFAGEATNIHSCGTVPGAMESGRRAARELCRSLPLQSKL